VSERVLITGGSGFIGSHLAEALLARGDRVVVLDNLSSGCLTNVESLRWNPSFTFVQGSVLDELMVDELVHESEVIVHLAAAVGVKMIIEQPLRSFTTNIRGSQIVIEAAHRYQRKLVIASTSEVYGKNPNVPLSEDADRLLGSPSVARWAYSTAKAVDEILAFAYHRERGLRSIIVRFFNTVGPGQSPAYGMVIPRLVRQALAGEPITVYGDGTQTRCFCHVDDVVDAVVRLMGRPDAIGQAFNIGSSEEVSILELARRIVARAGTSSPIQLVPYEEAYDNPGFEDMQRRVPDTARIRSLIGWAPTKTLDDIIDETLADAQADKAVELPAQSAH
jgi:UDP-glucose 4-epimerase